MFPIIIFLTLLASSVLGGCTNKAKAAMAAEGFAPIENDEESFEISAHQGDEISASNGKIPAPGKYTMQSLKVSNSFFEVKSINPFSEVSFTDP
jgi:outer membrane lipoprotein-sorting protein